MNTAKLKKSAKRLDTLFKVLQKIILIAMIVAGCILLVLTVVNAMDPDVLIGKDLHEIAIGPITVTLAEGYTPNNNSILTYGWILLSLGGVSAAAIYYAFGCIRKILQSVMQENPFYASVGKHIRKIGYVCIALGIVENAGGILESYNLLRNYGLRNLLNSSMISNITVNYQLDFTFLILFFVLLLLSYIFEYGTQLQQLSDETL